MTGVAAWLVLHYHFHKLVLLQSSTEAACIFFFCMHRKLARMNHLIYLASPYLSKLQKRQFTKKKLQKLRFSFHPYFAYEPISVG